MELDSLPTEIIWNILARVPTLDLIRLRCVCKSWKHIIEEPYFHQLQFSCSSSNPINNQFLVLQQHDERLLLIGLSDEKRVIERELKYPIWRDSGVKFHNGFLCFCRINDYDWTVDGRYWKIIIMNPITNQQLELPILDDMKGRYYDYVETVETCGFVFDPTTNHYKVVVYVEFYQPQHYEFMVFDSERKRWSVKKRRDYVINRDLQTLVNGRLHWMTLAGDKIVSFDLTNEKFSQVELPRGSLENPQLMAFDGKLCIVNHCQQGNTLRLQIWVMQKYGDEESWKNNVSLQHDIPFEMQTEELHIVLVGEADNGKILLVCEQETMLFYDIEGGKFRFLGSEGLPIDDTEENKPTAIHIANLCSIIS